MTWRASDPQGNESFKIRHEIVKWTRGRGLDLGCGPLKLYPHFIGVDNGKDEQLFNIAVKPDIRANCEDLNMFTSGSMDFVFSSHLLEHFEYSEVPKVLKEWWRVLKKDGFLVLYLPDENQYPKVGQDHANVDHKWNVNYDLVIKAMESFSWDLMDYQVRSEDNEYSLYFVFRKLNNGKHFSYRNPKPTKTACVFRYGAFGDLLQASSVFKGLKKQGYHVTVFASPPGVDVIKHDPNIDAFYIQDKDQVPNHTLGDFWAYHAKKYDKVVNLCESVEGSFLAIPGRTFDNWSPKARHEMMDHNYLEMQHKIADIPYEPNMRFYPLDSEKEWARKERAKMGKYVIVWALAGSSVHKTWAGLDRTIAALLIDFPEVHIVLVGGQDAFILQSGWQKEPRVHLKCGVWTIRESLSFLEQADMVIGPETGVLNAASGLPIPKICFLSHSTEKNLTRDWVNTHSIFSKNTVCPGRGNNDVMACHQLHYDWSRCKQVKEGEMAGTSQCMADIDGRQVYLLIWGIIGKTLEEVA